MKKLGFTLAEVLITLVIIGVIAAMTVPTLMQNTNAQEYRSGLKKAMSTLNQALTLHYALEGLSIGDYTTATQVRDNIFAKRMQVVDTRGSGTGASIWSSTATSVGISRNIACNGPVWTTNDGMKYCIIAGSFKSSPTATNQTSPCNSFNTLACATNGVATSNMLIDVNGDRKPNMLTITSSRPRDIYTATIYSQKIVPYGSASQEVMFEKSVTAESK